MYFSVRFGVDGGAVLEVSIRLVFGQGDHGHFILCEVVVHEVHVRNFLRLVLVLVGVVGQAQAGGDTDGSGVVVRFWWHVVVATAESTLELLFE